MSAVPSREVTTTQVTGVLFGFYSSEEVRGRTSGKGVVRLGSFSHRTGGHIVLLCLHLNKLRKRRGIKAACYVFPYC
jgi:hypothetical protein